MSTETPNPPSMQKSVERHQFEERARYAKVPHYMALGLLIGGPIIILLPPRKLDFYTLLAASGTVYGANFLSRERTGFGIIQRLQGIAPAEPPTDRAREIQAQIKEAKQIREKEGLRWETATAEAVRIKAIEAKKRVEDERRRRAELDSKPEWKKERDRKEKEYLEEGKGYQDLIMDQIWDVWNWGQVKTEEIKKEDEKVVEARKEEEKKK